MLQFVRLIYEHPKVFKVNSKFNITTHGGLGEIGVWKKQTNPYFNLIFSSLILLNTVICRNSKCLVHIMDCKSDNELDYLERTDYM